MFKRASFSILSISLLATAFVTGGCTSADRHSFNSTESLPVSVSLLRTGEDSVLWHMDVPTNHRLDIKLNRRDEAELFATTGRPADHMTWTLYDEGSPYRTYIKQGTRRVGHGEMELGGQRTRLYVTHREAGHPGDPQPKSNVVDNSTVIEESVIIEDQPPLPEEATNSEQPANDAVMDVPASQASPVDNNPTLDYESRSDATDSQQPAAESTTEPTAPTDPMQ